MSYLDDKNLDGVFDELFDKNKWEDFVVEDENQEFENIDEKRRESSSIEKKLLDKREKYISQYVKSKISLNIIGIIKKNEKDRWRKINRLILIIGFIIILIGIPTFIYKFLNNYYFVYKLYKEESSSWIDILVILYSSWKLIHLTLTKIVDYVFLVDNALLNTMVELIKVDDTSNNNVKNLEKEENDDLFSYFLKKILKKRLLKLKNKKELKV